MKSLPTDIHILITGGTGSIGKPLTSALLGKGYQVRHLSRKPGNNPRVKTFLWDVSDNRVDEHCIDGVDIVIHLAGEGIADKRWTDKRKKQLTESRTKSIGLIYGLIKNRPNKVNSVISAAAVGYYGNRADELMTEESEPGTGFMPECCIAWEKAVDEGKTLGLRIVKFRTGVVLDKNSGALPQMATPVKLFAGASYGDGKQCIPWIHWQDAVDMYVGAVSNINLAGVYNMVAPNPATNKQLLKAVAHQLHRPLWFVKIPKWAFKLLLGEMSVVVLGSTKASAQKILEAGFTFTHPELTEALKSIYS